MLRFNNVVLARLHVFIVKGQPTSVHIVRLENTFLI